MPNNNTHIINKVNVELNTSSTVPSEKVSTIVQRAIEDMDDLLDKHFGEAFYRFDSLSVQLDIKKEDLSRLETLLQKAFKQKIDEIASSERAAGQRERLQQHLPTEYGQRLALYFLRTGRFPWWAQPDAMAEIEQWLERVSADEWRNIIRPEAKHNNQVIKRSATQFSKAVVRKLIKKSFANTSQVDDIIMLLGVIEEFLVHINLPYGRSEQLMRRLYERALEGALTKEKKEKLFGQLITVVLQKMAELTEAQRDFVQAWKKWLAESDRSSKNKWISVTEEIIDEGTLKREKSSRVNKVKDPADDPEDEYSEEDDLNLTNAGLVLLQPFIELLFGNIGLVENDDFRNKDARQRAVCLLHYLASGSEEFPEQELVLPKFLCEWPLQEPVNRFLPISDYEKQECDTVLESCINHWSTLKNTSADELRSGFLRREGILKKEPFGWSLYVEEQTQDILLEQLPWSLSVVKFKWMDEILTVQWGA